MQTEKAIQFLHYMINYCYVIKKITKIDIYIIFQTLNKFSNKKTFKCIQQDTTKY